MDRSGLQIIVMTDSIQEKVSLENTLTNGNINAGK